MSYKPLVIMLLLCPMVAWGQLKDPQFRNEDISGTAIQATVNSLNNGFYEYIYNVQFPKENMGSVLTVELDITCNLDFGEVYFPEPPDEGVRYLSPDGAHTPVQLNDHERTTPAVTVRNFAKWGVHGDPGSPAITLRLISPALPTSRHYEIWPYMSTTGWDYPELEDHPEIPWVDDFKITGYITGPACDTSAPTPVFPGNRQGFETEEANQLLTYREPMRDRWHADEGQESVTFTIVYADTIDPDTFNASPGWARSYFTPRPGTEETVELPLRPGVNKFIFEASVANTAGPRRGEALHHSEKDRDEFEIRVAPRGRGYKKP